MNFNPACKSFPSFSKISSSKIYQKRRNKISKKDSEQRLVICTLHFRLFLIDNSKWYSQADSPFCEFQLPHTKFQSVQMFTFSGMFYSMIFFVKWKESCHTQNFSRFRCSLHSRIFYSKMFLLSNGRKARWQKILRWNPNKKKIRLKQCEISHSEIPMRIFLFSGKEKSSERKCLKEFVCSICLFFIKWQEKCSMNVFKYTSCL